MSPTKTTIIAALTLTVLANEATAQSDTNTNPTQYVSPARLHEWCQQEPARAFYYVAGVMDALMMSADRSNLRVCLPARSTTLEQARDVVCKYLSDNPAKRHFNLASSVWVAQSEAWPCTK